MSDQPNRGQRGKDGRGPGGGAGGEGGKDGSSGGGGGGGAGAKTGGAGGDSGSPATPGFLKRFDINRVNARLAEKESVLTPLEKFVIYGGFFIGVQLLIGGELGE